MITKRKAQASGLSMSEMLIVIGVIGILAGVAIPNLMNSLGGAKYGAANNILEMLNSGIHRFNETNYEMIVAATSGTTEEMAIVRTLQYRNPTYPIPGSPYIRDNWNPGVSSDSTTYRFQWTGKLFKILKPGTTGSGLKFSDTGGDMTTTYVHPPNFTMAGQ